MKLAFNIEGTVEAELSVTARDRSISVWVKNADGTSKAYVFKRMPGTSVCDYVASATNFDKLSDIQDQIEKEASL